MFERNLTRLIDVGIKRAAGERSVVWGIIAVVAWGLRFALRDVDDTTRVNVRPGENVSVRVRERTR